MRKQIWGEIGIKKTPSNTKNPATATAVMFFSTSKYTRWRIWQSTPAPQSSPSEPAQRHPRCTPCVAGVWGGGGTYGIVVFVSVLISLSPRQSTHLGQTMGRASTIPVSIPTAPTATSRGAEVFFAVGVGGDFRERELGVIALPEIHGQGQGHVCVSHRSARSVDDTKSIRRTKRQNNKQKDNNHSTNRSSSSEPTLALIPMPETPHHSPVGR